MSVRHDPAFKVAELNDARRDLVEFGPRLRAHVLASQGGQGVEIILDIVAANVLAERLSQADPSAHLEVMADLRVDNVQLRTQIDKVEAENARLRRSRFWQPGAPEVLLAVAIVLISGLLS